MIHSPRWYPRNVKKNIAASLGEDASKHLRGRRTQKCCPSNKDTESGHKEGNMNDEKSHNCPPELVSRNGGRPEPCFGLIGLNGVSHRTDITFGTTLPYDGAVRD